MLFLRLCLFLLLSAIAACGPTYPDGPPRPDEVEIAALRQAFLALGPDIDAGEAARAAEIAYFYPLQLAESYEITDPPVVHNIKVNRGLKARGLCFEWADDMQARLAEEEFRTLALHRAIATPPLRLEHSTVIVSRRGDAWHQGIVLDPWRYGGKLFWSPVAEDDRYPWRARQDVFAERRAQRQVTGPL